MNDNEVLNYLYSAQKYISLIPLNYPEIFNNYVNDAETNIIKAIEYLKR